MATCELCKREMLTALGCVNVPIENFKDGVVRAPIPFGEEKRYGTPLNHPVCGDCHTTQGQPHHPGCDMEECPRCGRQFIGCGCLDDVDAPEAKA